MKLGKWLRKLTTRIAQEETEIDDLFLKFKKDSREYKILCRILEESKKAAVSGKNYSSIPFRHHLYDESNQNEDIAVKKVVEILKKEFKSCDFEFVGGPFIPERGFIDIKW